MDDKHRETLRRPHAPNYIQETSGAAEHFEKHEQPRARYNKPMTARAQTYKEKEKENYDCPCANLQEAELIRPSPWGEHGV